jgi:PmbA protein
MPDLTELCGAAVDAARDGDHVEAYASEGRQMEVRVRAGQVESLTFSESRGVGVRVISDGRVGYAYDADPDLDRVRGLVEDARDSAGFAEPDPGNVLPSLSPVEPLGGLFDAGLADMDTDRKVALAMDVERATVSRDPSVTKVESASYGDAIGRVALQSTSGGPLEYERTDCWVAAVALAERGGETQTGFDVALARGVGDLDWERAGGDAAIRAARLLGGTKPKTERMPVVLDPGAATSFLSVLAGSLSAEAVQKGRSPLASLIGEQVGSALVTLVDDGRLAEGPASSPFDDEGVETQRTTLVEDGVLQGFLHNTYTAARAGARSTGNAGRGGHRTVPGVSPSNLFLRPGTVTVEELLRQAGRAVFVQDVTGLHSGASSVSGDFSVGAAGLMVQDGALGGPLREMTIASTLLDVLKAVAATASDLRFFPFGGGLGSPTVLVGEMTVAGA